MIEVDWQPFETAPKKKGNKILVWCEAAESADGIVEMVYRRGRYRLVVDHPWPNACLNPRKWAPSIEPPKKTR